MWISSSDKKTDSKNQTLYKGWKHFIPIQRKLVFTLTEQKNRRYPTENITEADYVDDLVILTDHLKKATSSLRKWRLDCMAMRVKQHQLQIDLTLRREY